MEKINNCELQSPKKLGKAKKLFSGLVFSLLFTYLPAKIYTTLNPLQPISLEKILADNAKFSRKQIESIVDKYLNNKDLDEFSKHFPNRETCENFLQIIENESMYLFKISELPNFQKNRLTNLLFLQLNLGNPGIKQTNFIPKDGMFYNNTIFFKKNKLKLTMWIAEMGHGLQELQLGKIGYLAHRYVYFVESCGYIIKYDDINTFEGQAHNTNEYMIQNETNYNLNIQLLNDMNLILDKKLSVSEIRRCLDFCLYRDLFIEVLETNCSDEYHKIQNLTKSLFIKQLSDIGRNNDQLLEFCKLSVGRLSDVEINKKIIELISHKDFLIFLEIEMKKSDNIYFYLTLYENFLNSIGLNDDDHIQKINTWKRDMIIKYL